MAEVTGGDSPECVKCGSCTSVCPVYLVTGREGHTARGKQHLLGRLAPGSRRRGFHEIFSRCLLCGACRWRCPRNIDTPAAVIAARSEPDGPAGHPFSRYLGVRAMEHPALLQATAPAVRMLAGHLPEDSGLRLRLAAFDPAVLPPPGRPFLAAGQPPAAEDGGAGCQYFVGCLGNSLLPGIGRATTGLLAAAGREAAAPADQGCCGLAALAAGRPETARRLAEKNIRAFESGTGPVLTSCATCYSHLRRLPELFADDPPWRRRAEAFAGRVREFFSYFLSRWAGSGAPFKALPRPVRVLYHDPCHLRFAEGITVEPRRLLELVPGLELVSPPAGPGCCGQGGLFAVAHPDLSGRIRRRLLAGAGEAAADLVVTSCSGCLLQWRQVGMAAEHPAVLLHPLTGG